MAVQVLKDCKIYLGAYNLSNDHNKIAVATDIDILDKTAFNATSKGRVAGLIGVGIAGEGFFEAGTDKIDPVLFSNLGVADAIVTVCPNDGSAGSLGFATKTVESQYSPIKNAVGELASFSMEASGTGNLVRGTVMENGAKTVTGNGTARNLGAVSASQKLYAVMHVLAVAGTNPTLDMVIQSDDAQGFASPANRATFAQKTAVGSEWVEVAGAITDTWWRASWTVGGTGSPSFTVLVVLAIQ